MGGRANTSNQNTQPQQRVPLRAVQQQNLGAMAGNAPVKTYSAQTREFTQHEHQTRPGRAQDFTPML